MRIAIVDDIQDVRSRMAALIEEFANQHHLHYQLDSYASGEKFLERFEAHSYDIIFLDIYMDGISGTETAEKIRQAGQQKAQGNAPEGKEDGAPKIPVGDQLPQAEHNRNRRYQKDLLSQCHGAQLPDDKPHGHRPQPHTRPLLLFLPLTQGSRNHPQAAGRPQPWGFGPSGFGDRQRALPASRHRQ